MSTKQTYRNIVLRFLPGTQSEIRDKTGFPQSTVSRWLARLHADGKAHICAWQESSSGPVAMVYAAGPGVDAPPPVTMSAKEVTRRVRKPTVNVDEFAYIKTKRRDICMVDQAPRLDPLMQALFGRA